MAGADVAYYTLGGKIIISEISATRAKGTFNLKVKSTDNTQTIDITNGVFNVVIDK